MLRSCLEPSGTGSLNSILMRSRAPSWRPFSTRGVTFPCPTQSDWWQPCWIYRSVQKLSEHVLIGWNKKWFANCNRMKGSMWFRRCECVIYKTLNLLHCIVTKMTVQNLKYEFAVLEKISANPFSSAVVKWFWIIEYNITLHLILVYFIGIFSVNVCNIYMIV